MSYLADGSALTYTKSLDVSNEQAEPWTQRHHFMAGARNPRKVSAWILAGIAGVEGVWVVWNWAANPGKFTSYLGFASGRAGNGTGWILGLVVAVLFIVQSARLPSVRANLVRPSLLKLLALAVAVTAGILEEVFFRRLLMDAVQNRGFGLVLQVVASGLVFGLAHGVWGLLGRSLRTAAGATVITGALGAALALVYIASGRSLAPCVAAHFLIDAFIEPGLVLAVTRGEMVNRT